MTENIDLKSQIMDIFLHPDISGRRIIRILSLFQEKHPEEKIDSLLNAVIQPDLLDKILKDSNIWISQDLEKSILNHLLTKDEIYDLVIQSGREIFFAISYDLLPTDNSQLNFLEILLRIPVFVNKYSRHIQLSPVEYLEKKVSMEVDCLHNYSEEWYDYLFLQGIIQGAAELLQVKRPELVIEQSKLNENKIIRKYHPNIQFGSEKTLFYVKWEESLIKVGRTQLKQNTITESKVFTLIKEDNFKNEHYSYLDLNSIIDKSKQLYIENRDLEAAVEVLSSLKNELILKQKSISKDLRMARNIQKGIIPQTIPDWKNLRFAVKYIPLQEVSGDYYDYFNYGFNKLGVVVADVAGHGIPAALITALSKLLFINYKLDSPSEIFASINNELLNLVKLQSYLTCFYCLVDSNYEVTYAIAGHPRPILFKYNTQETIILEGEGTFLGMFPDAKDLFKDYKILLEPGDKILIYTDGISEGRSDDGTQFEQTRLIDAIKGTHGLNVQQTLAYVMDKHRSFCMGADQCDDITLLVIGRELESDKSNSSHSDVYSQNDNYIEVCKLLSHAHQLVPTDQNILFLLAKYTVRIRNFQEAIRYLVEYNSNNILNPDSRLMLGYCYYCLNDYEKSILVLNDALTLNYKNSKIYYLLAKSYFKLNKIEESINLIHQILDRDPNFKPAIRLLKILK